MARLEHLKSIGVVDDSLVLAWAKDIDKGGPVYILELGDDRNGGKSRCVCMGCGEPLQAVNAGKEVGTYQKRPHFRHHTGVEKDTCAVLTARALALDQLKALGIIELPRRRRSGQAVGLSGMQYEAWVELPPERSFVKDFSFVDSMRAVVTLEDGREFDVVLVGSVAEAEGVDTTGALKPEIRILVEGSEFSGLDPSQLQEALRIRIKEGFWCSHWKDQELVLEAQKEARRKSKEGLDWISGDVLFPEGTTDAEKRETLLHALAKQILEREKRMMLPRLEMESDLPSVRGFDDPDPVVLMAEKFVCFSAVELEKRVGSIRPDVIASVEGNDDARISKLAIEITVTHGMKPERIAKIEAAGIPTIEVNLSRLGGVLTENTFTDVLINSLEMKSWIFHPDLQSRNGGAKEVKSTNGERHFADLFLREMRAYGLADAKDQFGTHAYQTVKENVKRLAYKLSELGYQSAVDSNITCPDGLINRLQSIKEDACIGYKYTTSWQVINAILQDKGWNTRFHSVYLMAVKAWNPTMSAKQRVLYEKWREDVVTSLKSGERTYVREPIYDNLLCLLFPDLALGIRRPLPGSKLGSQWQHEQPIERPTNAAHDPKAVRPAPLSGRTRPAYSVFKDGEQWDYDKYEKSLKGY